MILVNLISTFYTIIIKTQDKCISRQPTDRPKLLLQENWWKIVSQKFPWAGLRKIWTVWLRHFFWFRTGFKISVQWGRRFSTHIEPWFRRLWYEDRTSWWGYTFQKCSFQIQTGSFKIKNIIFSSNTNLITYEYIFLSIVNMEIELEELFQNEILDIYHGRDFQVLVKIFARNHQSEIIL